MSTIIDTAFAAASARNAIVEPVSDIEQLMIMHVIRQSKGSLVELPQEYQDKLTLLLRELRSKGWPDCVLTDITVSTRPHLLRREVTVFRRERRAVYSTDEGTGFTSLGEVFDGDLMVKIDGLDPDTCDALMDFIDELMRKYRIGKKRKKKHSST